MFAVEESWSMPAKLVENRQPPASRGGSDEACLKKTAKRWISQTQGHCYKSIAINAGGSFRTTEED